LRAELQPLLDLLAVVRTPLTAEEIVALLGEGSRPALRLLADLAARFPALVSGGPHQPYSLAHPRLAEAFAARLSPVAQNQLRGRFHTICQQLVQALDQGTLPPVQLPAGFLHAYGAQLADADQPPQALLTAFSSLLCEGWLRAWQAAEGTKAGFLVDVARAWTVADQCFTPIQPAALRAQALTVAIQAAFCQASVISHSTNDHPTLLQLALTQGFLTPTQALAVAITLPQQRRPWALVALVPVLPVALLPQVLAVVPMLAETGRAAVLAVLAPRLDDEGLAQALAELRVMDDGNARVQALEALAPYLAGPLLASALALVPTLRDDSLRSRSLAALVPRLDDLLLAEALAWAQTTTPDWARASMLRALAPVLHGSLLAEALESALSIGTEANVMTALVALAPQLDGALLMQAVRRARAMKHDASRANALGALAARLPSAERLPLLAEVLQAIHPDDHGGPQPLAAFRLIAPHLVGPLVADALTLACGIESEHDRAKALAALAPVLPEPLMTKALESVRSLSHVWWVRFETLVAFLPRQRGAAREQLLAEALAGVRAKVSPGSFDSAEAKTFARLLDAIGPALTPELQGEVLAVALAAIGPGWDFGGGLHALAPHLDQPTLAAALEAAQQQTAPTFQTMILMALAPALQGPLLEAALAQALGLENPWNRVRALAVLIPHLPAAQQAPALREALAADRVIADDGGWGQVIGALGAYMDAPTLAEAVATALALPSALDQADTLALLAPSLTVVLQAKVWAAVRAFESDRYRVKVLAALAPYLPAPLVVEALAAARTLHLDTERAQVLTALAPQLQGTLLEEALAAAEAIDDVGYRTRIVKTLLETAGRPAQEPKPRGRATQAARAAPSPEHPTALEEALTTAHAIQRRWGLGAQALVEHLPHLTAAERERVLREALAAARAIGSENPQVQVVQELAPHLSGSLVVEALELTDHIVTIWHRVRARQALCPGLLALVHTDPALAAAAWRDSLHRMAAGSRDTFLRDLAAILPVGLALTGEAAPQAAAGIFHAIKQSRGWWQ
jgi:hypothetical protein